MGSDNIVLLDILKHVIAQGQVHELAPRTQRVALQKQLGSSSESQAKQPNIGSG